MFPMRRAALRFLTIQPAPFAVRSRTITTFSTPLRTQKQAVSLFAQRRWASDESAKAEEAPISRIQPTPQEEVENAIHEDNAAPSDGRFAESAADIQGSGRSESNLDTAQAVGARASGFDANRTTRDSRSPAEAVPGPTVYMGNLFFDVTEDDLTKELSRFGEVKNVKIIRDNRGLSKGFGYVTFDSTDAAAEAIAQMNLQLYEGRRVTVQYAVARRAPTFRKSDGMTGLGDHQPQNPPSKTLFIGNMSWSMNDRDLNALFRDISGLLDVRVAIDRRTGDPRGFAHADFRDVKHAMDAMKQLSGKEVYGRRLKLDYAFASSAAPKTQARDRGEL